MKTHFKQILILSMILSMILILAGIESSATQKNVKSTANTAAQIETKHVAMIESLLKNYGTLEDALLGLKNTGVLVGSEYKELTKLLVKYEANPKKILEPAQIKQDGIYWGRIGWKKTRDGYLLSNGKTIAVQSDETPIQVIKKIAEGFKQNKTVQFSLLWSSAFANDKSSSQELMASVGVGVDHIARFAFGDVLLPASATAQAALGHLIEITVTPFREYFRELKVTCDYQGHFVIPSVEKNKAWDQREIDLFCKRVPKALKTSWSQSHSDGLCAYSAAMTGYLQKAATPLEQQLRIKDEYLKAIFKKDRVPYCTTARAKLVELDLRENYKNVKVTEDTDATGTTESSALRR